MVTGSTIWLICAVCRRNTQLSQVTLSQVTLADPGGKQRGLTITEQQGRTDVHSATQLSAAHSTQRSIDLEHLNQHLLVTELHHQHLLTKGHQRLLTTDLLATDLLTKDHHLHQLQPSECRQLRSRPAPPKLHHQHLLVTDLLRHTCF